MPVRGTPVHILVTLHLGVSILIFWQDQAWRQDDSAPGMGIGVVYVELVNGRPCQHVVTEHALRKVCLPSEVPRVQDPPKGALEQEHEGPLQE